MKPKILKIFGWHLLFFFFYYELRISLEDQSFDELASWLILKDGLLNLSSFLIFFCYSLGAYLVLLYYYPKSILKAILSISGTILIIMACRYCIEEVFFLRVFGFDNYYDGLSILSYGLRNLFYAFLHLALGCIFFFIQYSSYKEKKEQELLIETKKNELIYLQSQINPHFLFNTLNNIYSLVYRNSDKALPALDKLTSILRYSLYEKKEKITLAKELENMKNFILLEEIRYNYPLNIDFNVDGNIADYMIPPFLLLPLVENAFKHGDMKSPLKISLHIFKESLKFNVCNFIQVKQKDKLGGIGLENIQKRLKLIYGDRQQLIIYQNESFFDVSLVINS